MQQTHQVTPRKPVKSRKTHPKRGRGIIDISTFDMETKV